MAAPEGNDYAKGNPGGGRPSEYKPEYARIAEMMCKLGATDIEIADALGVSSRTIYKWKAAHDEFCSALKTGKEQADERVQRALYARATGYEHDEVDIRVVSGEIVQTPIRKYYPPDTTAGIFWLKNRRPAEWRDKVEQEITGADGGPIQQRRVVEYVGAPPKDE